jgi:probable phosphoglycerate mutase
MSKTIITVQHTESEHHLNGHAGAWGKWPFTEKGHQQDFEIEPDLPLNLAPARFSNLNFISIACKKLNVHP